MNSTHATLKGITGTIGAKVGSVILMDGGRYLHLDACELADFADFRAGGTLIPFALNVHVTGRTYQRRGGDLVVKVRIQAVGDGEPDNNFGAWLLVNGAAIN